LFLTEYVPAYEGYGFSEESSGGYSMHATPVGDSSKPSLTPKASSDLFARFYWNERLQVLLQRPVFTPEDSRQRNAEVKQLLDRFIVAATPVVETIVKELRLPVADKTIKPIDVGGIAGGTKFIHNNLFIKIAEESQSHLYGDTHFSQKACKHELKSVR
jgi:hypothetical protein